MHKRQQNPVNTKKWHEEVTINFQHFQHTLLISQLLQKLLLFHRNMLIYTLTLERLPHNLLSLCSVCPFTWSDFYSSSFTFKLFLRWICSSIICLFLNEQLVFECGAMIWRVHDNNGLLKTRQKSIYPSVRTHSIQRFPGQ